MYNCLICFVFSVPPATTFLSPQCSLPRNLAGTWLTQGVQYQSNIRVNDTLVYFNTQINEYEYQETVSSRREPDTSWPKSSSENGKQGCVISMQILEVEDNLKSNVLKYIGHISQMLDMTDNLRISKRFNEFIKVNTR